MEIDGSPKSFAHCPTICSLALTVKRRRATTS